LKRHKWGEPSRDVYLTTRICRVCGLMKITHHEGNGFPWITFHESPSDPAVSPMPQCEAETVAP
jgi:hypothetical protein